jgi:hypothetical protein
MTSPSEWRPGDRVELGPDTVPLVFYHFRPTAVEVVTPDRIAEWERLMQEKVGVRPGWDDTAELRAVRTLSVCNGPGFCDCDQEWV